MDQVGTVAGDILVATVVDREDGGLRRLGRGVWQSVVAATEEMLPGPNIADIVVTDRRTGRVQLRLPVSMDTAGPTMQQVERDLAALSPEAFLEEWGAQD